MENTKSELRNLIRKRRGNLNSTFQLGLLTNCDEFESAKVIASYRSYGDEPSTENLNQLILSAGKQLLLPRLLSDNRLEFCSWDGDLRKLQLNGKVEEPLSARFEGMIDLIIVPALAIDKAGNRLGQGGGSYDRALHEFKVFSIALVNEDEVIDALPSEGHDQKVNAALTPTSLIRF